MYSLLHLEYKETCVVKRDLYTLRRISDSQPPLRRKMHLSINEKRPMYKNTYTYTHISRGKAVIKTPLAYNIVLTFPQLISVCVKCLNVCAIVILIL